MSLIGRWERKNGEGKKEGEGRERGGRRGSEEDKLNKEIERMIWKNSLDVHIQERKVERQGSLNFTLFPLFFSCYFVM